MTASLTIAIPTYREPCQSLWATVTACRLQSGFDPSRDEVLILDNAPDSPEGKAIGRWCLETATARYEPYSERVGTAITRDECYRRARGDVVMVIDAHVQLWPGALDAICQFYEDRPDSPDLLHGPLYWIGSTSMDDYSTELTSSWGGDGMKGQWYRRSPLPTQPFAIYSHGMGLSVCRRDAWLWSCADETETMVGFGGEEGHVGELFKKHKRAVWCVPGLRWSHCFVRSEQAPYPNRWYDRARNNILWTMRLGTYRRQLEHVEYAYTLGHEGKPPHLTPAEWRHLIADPIAHVEPPRHRGSHASEATGGPGTELHRLLAQVGINPSAACDCRRRMRLMDSWGVSGCRQRIDEIREWLTEEARRRKWHEIAAAAVGLAAGGVWTVDGLIEESIRAAAA